MHLAFTISPSSQVVGVGQVAVFRCQNVNADNVYWRVNETSVTFNSPHPDPGIAIDRTTDENDNVVNLLSIAAQSNYNETVIVCAANFLVGGSLTNDTTPVKLLIQGEPAPDSVHVSI
jgi:alpha/beta superfamily hydrolase